MAGHYPYSDDFEADERLRVEQRKEALQAMQADIRRLMSEIYGRLFIARILNVCRIDESVFRTNGTLNAYEQGIQSVGYWISSLIDELEDGDELRHLMKREYRNLQSRLANAV